ncbi:unnamed protein product [Darwinula stevensoni]|uniref:Cytochrome P450 n=1 Tax=Darwinula stevensoni TaxID=69355 RepID=A0A7R8WZ65_9CRUS|nr:unnamed protein product [Darwinula stevensoni]CAG0880197.1 unnamed protein product [Darwinula stevensoni]
MYRLPVLRYRHHRPMATVPMPVPLGLAKRKKKNPIGAGRLAHLQLPYHILDHLLGDGNILDASGGHLLQSRCRVGFDSENGREELVKEERDEVEYTVKYVDNDDGVGRGDDGFVKIAVERQEDVGVESVRGQPPDGLIGPHGLQSRHSRSGKSVGGVLSAVVCRSRRFAVWEVIARVKVPYGWKRLERTGSSAGSETGIPLTRVQAESRYLGSGTFLRIFALLARGELLGGVRSAVADVRSDATDRGLDDLPGPRPSVPVIGTNWVYWLPGNHPKTQLHRAYLDRYHEYGAISKEEFQWRRPLIHVYDPEDFERVLRRQGKCPIRPVNEAVRHLRSEQTDRYASAGLVNTQGEEWYELRKKLTPSLMNVKVIQRYMKGQNELALDLTELVGANRTRNDAVHDFDSLLFRTALESVSMLCLDARIGALKVSPPPAALHLLEAVHSLWEAYQNTYFGTQLWRYFSTPAYRQYSRAEDTIYEYIDEAEARLEEKKGNSREEGEKSVLEELLNTPHMDKRDIRMTMIDFITGGIDTTANVMLFLLYQLSKNQSVQEELYKEIRRVLQGQAMTPESLADMHYLKACVKEVFRLMPTIPNLVRILPEDVNLKGYFIPAGIPICCHTMTACLLPENFPEPQSFKPERWLNRSFSHPFLLLPFGWGPRMCVGRRFAEQEIFVITAKLIEKFIFHYDGTLTTHHKFLIAPSEKVTFTVKERQV